MIACNVCRRDPSARGAADQDHLHPGHPMSCMGLTKVSGVTDLVYVKSGDELREMDGARAAWDEEYEVDG